MTSPIPLRERLAAAELASFEDGDDPQIWIERTNEQASWVALRVFSEWLREAAEGLHAVENAADIAGLFADQRTVLTGLADAIDKERGRDS